MNRPYLLIIYIAILFNFKFLMPKKHVFLPVIGKFDFQENERILDIGCGDGKLTAKIAKQVSKGKIWGIDVSENKIQTARQNFSEIKNLSFKISDSCNFSFKEKFDTILSIYAFHWIKNKISDLNHIKQCLKPSGRLFIIAVYHKNSMSSAFERLKGNNKWKLALQNRDKKFHAIVPEEYKKLLTNLGFKNIKIKIVNRKRYYHTFNDFVNYIMTWLPFCVELERNSCLELANILAKDVYNQLGQTTNNKLSRTVPFLSIQANS